MMVKHAKFIVILFFSSLATMSTQYLTQEKYEALQAELVRIDKEDLPALARRIDEARQMGDLSENAEYHAAREEMGWKKGRRAEIEAILDAAEIITAGGDQDGMVSVGSTIVVEVAGKEREYMIVGPQEADPLARKISNESPLGMAFLGKSVGAAVEV
jgi:transcription elongation factor GreA